MKINILLIVLTFPFYCFAQQKTVDTLPKPFATKSVSNYSNVLGWENGRTPKAPAGFEVTKYADGFQNPRWMYVAPNGDVLVAESNSNYGVLKQIGATLVGAGKSNNLKNSADRITLLCDTNKDGVVDKRETFLTEGLNQPFGMLVIDNWFYVANTDALMRYPFNPEETKITGPGQKIADLPAGKINQHWTRNIIANEDNSKIYIAVGCGTNIAEKGMENEVMRANILELNPDGTGLKIYASGLRNPVGMDWNPKNNTLWTVVNERDGLGNNLVPDYLTEVKEDGFYGWPYSYFGENKDPRVLEKKPVSIKETLVPDFALGAHTASLGLVFYTGTSFPEKYRNGAFIAQHGSWNREILSGYKVVFVPFKNGKPFGKAQDFLTGFVVNPNKDEVYGRPVGIIEMPDGDLLLSDDVTHTLWRISAIK